MLILDGLLELKSERDDITAAFLHANLEEGDNVFVEMPLGFQKKGKVLKLEKTLYGLCWTLIHSRSVSLKNWKL